MNNTRSHLKTKCYKPVENRVYKGGGEGTYYRPEHKKHAEKIFNESETLKIYFSNTKDKNDTHRRYFRVELPEGKSVWSTDGKHISDGLLCDLVATPFKNVGHFSTLDTTFNHLVERLEQYSKSPNNIGKSKFAPIEYISNIPVDEKIDRALKNIINSNQYSGEALVTLYSDLNRVDQAAVKRNIDSYLHKKGGKIVGEIDSEQGKLLRIKASAEDIKNLAIEFFTIQSIDHIEEVFVNSSTKGERIENFVLVGPNNADAVVCIFDSGVTKNSRFLNDSIIGYEEPIGPPYDTDHGTFVASRIIFGNSLRDQISKGKLILDVKVLSVCMISHDEIGNIRPVQGEEFIHIIRQTVERWHNKIKVYNLSMSLSSRDLNKISLVDDHSVGASAAEIDHLQRKYGVIFILTTGNYETSTLPIEPYPEYFRRDDSRMLRPGESMLAITVGSITDRENDGSMAKSNCPSPFTRRGPGFNKYRKPDVVAQGGNYASNWRSFDDLSVTGIGKDGDSISYGNGTSYAAPLISRLAAKIFSEIEDAKPELVKALLIQFSKKIDNVLLDVILSQQLIGNGVPNSEDILSSDKWHQSYIFQGIIGPREIIRIPFYIPNEILNRKGNSLVGVKYTVVCSPETNRSLKKGYCKSHFRTKLHKLDKESNLKPVSDSDSSLNDRYNTVIRYDKQFSRGISSGEWELVIEQASRWTTKEKETRFAVIITVYDPKLDPAIDIYTAIQSEIPNRYEDMISIQEKIKI